MGNNQTTAEDYEDQDIDNKKDPEFIKEDSQVHTHGLRYAGFWMRFWAYLLDLIVVGSIDRILVKPIFRLLDIPILESNLFAPISVATAITFYAYFVLMTRYFQQTLGKMVFGLRVVGLVEERLSWKTILFREWIGRFISSTIVIGYIITAFLPKKQGLHDLFSDTSVVHEY
jgi:uncharacterized RDD family membrane protein YckC